MTLKAVLIDFHSTIIKDAALQQDLFDELLIRENLRPDLKRDRELCLGQPDRTCIQALLEQRGRVVEPAYLDQLAQQKALAYCQRLQSLAKLPIYVDIPDFFFKLRAEQIKIAIVTSELRPAVEQVLKDSHLDQYLDVLISGEQIQQPRPDPDGHLQAIAALNQQYPDLQCEPQTCLAVESSYLGIEAARRAGLSVVAIANLRPLHMLQRRANWVVDSTRELELDRIQAMLNKPYEQATLDLEPESSTT
ncbi:MAG: HAD family phosphatase [Cyanobacteria bacterium P01_H01_bin.121]